jgi:hypothetical protein
MGPTYDETLNREGLPKIPNREMAKGVPRIKDPHIPKRWKVTFQWVSPTHYPLYYRKTGGMPSLSSEEVPDEHWCDMAKHFRDQDLAKDYLSHLRRSSRTTLIRNVRLKDLHSDP